MFQRIEVNKYMKQINKYLFNLDKYGVFKNFTQNTTNHLENSYSNFDIRV